MTRKKSTKTQTKMANYSHDPINLLSSIREEMDELAILTPSINLIELPEQKMLYTTETNRECEHLYHVDDTHEGNTVCMDCGLVIEDKMYLATPSSTDFYVLQDSNIAPFIRDMCEKGAIPSSVFEYVLCCFQITKTQLENIGKNIKILKLPPFLYISLYFVIRYLEHVKK